MTPEEFADKHVTIEPVRSGGFKVVACGEVISHDNTQGYATALAARTRRVIAAAIVQHADINAASR